MSYSRGIRLFDEPVLLSSRRTQMMQGASELSTVVVGGGVTGLALAHRLLVLGGGRIGVTVLEAQSRPGGTAAACSLGAGARFP